MNSQVTCTFLGFHQFNIYKPTRTPMFTIHILVHSFSLLLPSKCYGLTYSPSENRAVLVSMTNDCTSLKSTLYMCKPILVRLAKERLSKCQGTNLTKSLSWWLKPQDMLYTLTRPLTRDPIGLEVWMRIGAEYSTLNEGWLRFEPVTSHVGFWYHVKEPI